MHSPLTAMARKIADGQPGTIAVAMTPLDDRGLLGIHAEVEAKIHRYRLGKILEILERKYPEPDNLEQLAKEKLETKGGIMPFIVQIGRNGNIVAVKDHRERLQQMEQVIGKYNEMANADGIAAATIYLLETVKSENSQFHLALDTLISGALPGRI